MNIMYAYDDNYVKIAAVSILSLLRTNDVNIHLFLVQDHVSKENERKMRLLLKDHANVVTYFMEKPDFKKLVGVEFRTLRWSDSAYSRLFLKELFKDMDMPERLLYLDCDTLVVGKLDDLYSTEIDEYLGAACLECMSNAHKIIIGAKKGDNYINSGMMLINVTKWLNEDVQKIFTEYIISRKGKSEYVDQGVINGTISNRMKIVSPKYNLTTLAFDFSYEEMLIFRKPSFGYSKAEWENAKGDPRLIHFTTSFLSKRPWYEGSTHPYARLWNEVNNDTLWRFQKKESYEKKGLLDKVILKLPRKILIRLAGFLHSYVKPVVFLIKK